MPPVSEKQRRAMEAAAHGHSTLGIPKKVGEEFVGADSSAGGGVVAGTVHVAPDGHVLLLRRASTEKNYANHWSLPGGNGDAGESPEDAADRENAEELGNTSPQGPKRLMDCRSTPTGKTFHTFAKPVDEKFWPRLNDEHSGAGWFGLNELPSPIHPAVKERLGADLGAAEDMDDDAWTALHHNFAAWARDTDDGKEQAQDSACSAMDEALAFDRAPPGLVIDRHGLAFDYAKPADSVRSESPDGHLHVEVSNISKAAVNPYRGDEIPNWRALGLAADKVYKLLRDPEELRKAASTFDNLPLLDEHVPVTASDHKPEHVIGSTGTDAEFDGSYLKNSLVVWASKAIDAINSEKKKELSSAYRYRADMTPGVHPKLGRYDGVMRDIVGNHVALVEDGRAGPDVVVGDSRNPLIPEEKFDMSKKVLLSRMGTVAYGALMSHLQPLLAMDAKLDLAGGLRDLNARNFKTKRPVLAAWLQSAVADKLKDPKMAQDGSIKAGLDAVLDMIEGMPKAEDEFPDKDDDKDKKAEDEGDDDDKSGAEDEGETAEEKAAREKAEKKAADKKAKDEAMEKDKDKKAMDAAMDSKVNAAVKAERELQQAIYAAKDHVRGRVGELASMAFDSVEGVYLHAIKAAGKDPGPLEGSKPEALKFVFDNLPSISSGAGTKRTYAYDSSGSGSGDGLAKRNPGLAKNLQRIGSA